MVTLHRYAKMIQGALQKFMVPCWATGLALTLVAENLAIGEQWRFVGSYGDNPTITILVDIDSVKPRGGSVLIWERRIISPPMQSPSGNFAVAEIREYVQYSCEKEQYTIILRNFYDESGTQLVFPGQEDRSGSVPTKDEIVRELNRIQACSVAK